MLSLFKDFALATFCAVKLSIWSLEVYFRFRCTYDGLVLRLLQLDLCLLFLQIYGLAEHRLLRAFGFDRVPKSKKLAGRRTDIVSETRRI